MALITGAGGGIGRASALRFSAEGARVVVVDVDETARARDGRRRSARAGGEADFVARRRDPRRRRRGDDRLRRAALRRAARAVQQRRHLSRRGRLGGRHRRGDRSTASSRVNLKGVFLGCKYGIPALLRAGGGSIINTASFVARDGRGDVAERLHRVEGRRAGADARDRRRVRPPRHPRQRAVPGAGQHAAAAVPARRPGARAPAASCTCRWAAWPRPRRSPTPRCSWPPDESSYVNGATFLVDGGTSGAYVTAL